MYGTVLPTTKKVNRFRAYDDCSIQGGLQPVFIGKWLAMVAFFGILADVALLCSYCTEYGCFQSGCGAPHHLHCLPAYSDVYLPSEGVWATGWVPIGNVRSMMAETFTLLFRTVLEPVLFYQAFCFFEEQAECRPLWRRVAFALSMLMIVVLTASAALLLNAGATQPLHVKTSISLVTTWLGVAGPLFFSVVPRSPWRLVIFAGWTCMTLEAVYLIFSWTGFGTSWFAFEWLSKFTHEATLVAIGLCLIQTTPA